MSRSAEQAQLEQRAQQAIEDVQRILEHAMERASDAPSDRVARLLGLAQNRLEAAREAFHAQRFEEAFNMATELRRLLETTLRDGGLRNLETMFERTLNLLERAKEDVGRSGQDVAIQMLARAEELLRQGQESYESGQPERARQQLTQARELILRAMRMAQAPPNESHVDRVLEEAASFVEDAVRRVYDSGNEDAISLVDTAVRHMRQAQELRNEGRLRRALSEARVARNLARRAVQLAVDGGL